MTLCNNLYSFRIITVLTNRNRISICCAGSILLFLYYVIMCSLWNVNCISITTFFTSVGPDSFFRTGCLSCNYTTIPVMIKFLSYFFQKKSLFHSLYNRYLRYNLLLCRLVFFHFWFLCSYDWLLLRFPFFYKDSFYKCNDVLFLQWLYRLVLLLLFLNLNHGYASFHTLLGYMLGSISIVFPGMS